jgi:hypothetical protein
LAAASPGEAAVPNAGPGEGKKEKPPLPVESVLAGVGEGKGAMALPPCNSFGDKEPQPPLALEPVGVSGCSGAPKNVKPPLAVGPVVAAACFGEAKNEKAPGGAVGSFGEATNANPPLAVEPVGVSGAAGDTKNDKALLPLDPVGVVGALGASSKNANMFPPPPPPPPPPVPPTANGKEKSLSGQEPRVPAREESRGGAVAGEGVGVGEPKGWSSSSTFLRGDEGGRRHRRFLPASQGAEKATAECARSMRSSARWWRGVVGVGAGEPKEGSRWGSGAASVAMVVAWRARAAHEFLDSWVELGGGGGGGSQRRLVS